MNRQKIGDALAYVVIGLCATFVLTVVGTAVVAVGMAQ
jgi:hypothetical protein